MLATTSKTSSSTSTTLVPNNHQQALDISRATRTVALAQNALLDIADSDQRVREARTEMYASTLARIEGQQDTIQQLSVRNMNLKAEGTRAYERAHQLHCTSTQEIASHNEFIATVQNETTRLKSQLDTTKNRIAELAKERHQIRPRWLDGDSSTEAVLEEERIKLENWVTVVDGLEKECLQSHFNNKKATFMREMGPCPVCPSKAFTDIEVRMPREMGVRLDCKREVTVGVTLPTETSQTMLIGALALSRPQELMAAQTSANRAVAFVQGAMLAIVESDLSIRQAREEADAAALEHIEAQKREIQQLVAENAEIDKDLVEIEKLVLYFTRKAEYDRKLQEFHGPFLLDVNVRLNTQLESAILQVAALEKDLSEIRVPGASLFVSMRSRHNQLDNHQAIFSREKARITALLESNKIWLKEAK